MKLFEPQALVIILIIVMIIFGPKQLPELGKSLGKTMKSIQDGLGEDDDPATRSVSAEKSDADA